MKIKLLLNIINFLWRYKFQPKKWKYYPRIYHPKPNWDICTYCKKTKEEVSFEFSWVEGYICTNCSDKWHEDHPKAMSREDVLNIKKYLDGKV